MMRASRPTAATASRFLLAGSAAVLLVRLLPPWTGLQAVLAAWAPYAVISAAAALVLALASRHRTLSAAATVAVLLTAAPQIPLFLPDGSRPATALRVATSNLLFGRADVHEVVRLVDEEQVDVLVLVELPEETRLGLVAAGLEQRLPYAHVAAGPRFAGTGMWSRYPLERPRRLDGFASAQLVADLTVPDAGPITVVAVHPAAPRPDTARDWRTEYGRLRTALDGLPGTVVAAGDFNATLDHRPLRAILGDGYADAAETAGEGLVRSWPNLPGMPQPLFGIDRVLLRGNLSAAAVRARQIAGSDHSAVVAELGWS